MPGKVVSAQMFGAQLEEILKLKRITKVDFHFHMDRAVTADVTFLLDDVQANAVVQMFKDGRWKIQQSE